MLSQPYMSPLVPVRAESTEVYGVSEPKPLPKPESNRWVNPAQTLPKPEVKPESGLGEVYLNQFGFDPLQDEQPGEYEAYLFLLKSNDWGPRCKGLLKALWGANPNTKKYDPAVQRRNLFAERFQEYSLKKVEV